MTQHVWDTVEGFHSRAKLNSEAAVQRLCRRILDHFDIWHYVPPANAYGQSGISDIICLSQGRTVALECKYKYNKPTANQLEFGANVERNGGLFLVVNERNTVLQIMRLIAYVQEGVDPYDGL